MSAVEDDRNPCSNWPCSVLLLLLLWLSGGGIVSKMLAYGSSIYFWISLTIGTFLM